MSDRVIKALKEYNRVITCPPDKSCSIRAVLMGAVANGGITIRNLSNCADVQSALNAIERLGASVERQNNDLYIVGSKLKSTTIDCGNSATTARLLMGLLAGQNGEFTLIGDSSLQSRPMRRVIEPLKAMGANITDTDGKLPVKIIGSNLHGITYDMPVSSAQVKSAILLAGVNASGKTTVIEKIKTRNHTENLLKLMNANITCDKNAVTVSRSILDKVEVNIVGDISSAVYPICLALALGGECEIKSVGINPTRAYVLDFLKSIGADVKITNLSDGIEPSCDIVVRKSRLKPFKIDENTVPLLVDEIPMLCGLACFIDGKSIVCGANELRVKESDRITSTVKTLNSFGAKVCETVDGMIIDGGERLKKSTVDSYDDHRIAMTAAVVGAVANGVTIKNAECVDISYPQFFSEVVDGEIV